MKYLCWLIVCWLLPFRAGCQDFNIYIFAAYYSKNVSQYLLEHSFREAHLLTQVVIDPDKDQNIDADAVRNYTAGFYPNADATGLFVIDWEAQAFNDLKKYDKDDARFKAAEAKYLQLVNVIKEFRPKVKVSIYGLPFRFFNDIQRKAASTDKLDNLLSHCDVLTPSFYIVYTDAQIGQPRNIDYLKQNIDLALATGARLNKEIVPFFWYKVHPGNKLYGMNIIPKDKMQAYLNTLSSYSYQGKKLNGIVWWEGGGIARKKPDKEARAFTGAANSAVVPGTDRDSIILDYAAPFIKK